MPQEVGYGAGSAFQPSLQTPRSDQLAEQVKAINARQSEAVAETVQRQANFSASRAEVLTRQAEQLEDRAQTRSSAPGLGTRLDISV